MSNVNVIEKNNVEYMYEDTAARDMLGVMQDDTLEAVQAYSVGNLFWYNNKLYRVIQPVANGATMVIDTDCVETDLETEREKAKNDGVGISSDLLKSTVGWTGKNDLPFKLSRIKELNTNGTWNGNVFSRVGATFTFSVNAEGYVTEVDVDSNGVATTGNNYITCLDFKDYQFAEGSYILSDVNGNANCYTYINRRLNDSGSVSYAIGTQNGDKSVDVDYTVYNQFQCGIGVPTGNVYNHVKLYPMLRDASITDDTYEPYHESVEEEIEQIYADNGMLGAKNILENTASNKSENNVSFVVNANKSVTVTTSGTVSAVTTLAIGEFKPLKETMVMNGVTGGSQSTYGFQLYDVTTSQWITQYATDGDSEITLDISHTYRVVLFVRNGVASGLNTTIYPMISLSGGEYVPYAMTNRELTEELTVQESAVTDIIEGATVGDLGNHLYKIGKLVWLMVRLNGVTTTAWADNTPIGMIPEGFRPRNGLRIYNSGNSNALQPIQINTVGSILSAVNLSNQIVILSATWITN